MQQNIPDGQIRSRHPLEHRTQCGVADLPRRLPQCGQGHGQKTSVLHIVDSNQAHVAGNGVAKRQQRVHQAASRAVVRALAVADQTLSFNASGVVLSKLIGASDFQRKVDGLARINLVQQGGELAYLIRHDPEFRGIRREHLVEAGQRVRLRSNIPALVEFLERGLDGYRVSFFVVSALHVNNRDGFTIAVSKNKQLARIAKSTVLSDDAFSVTVPILEPDGR